MGKKHGFLFSVSSTRRANTGSRVSAGVGVSAGRGVGKGRWWPGKAVVWSPRSRDPVGFRRTRTGSNERCFCRDLWRKAGFEATATHGWGRPLALGRPRFHHRQTPVTPEPPQGPPEHAPPGSPRLTRSAPALREKRNPSCGIRAEKNTPGTCLETLANTDLKSIPCEMLPTNPGEEPDSKVALSN